MKYHKKTYNLEDLPNWLTLLRDDIKLTSLGMGFARLAAGKGYTFLHKHENQEEIYILLNGKGVIYLDGELIDLNPGDVVRVNPEVYRAIKADDESELVCLIVGALPVEGFPRSANSKTLIDDGIPNWDHLPPWCEGNEKIIELNKKIRAQREGKKLLE
ncbi:cupin domain-containing protein [Candidatus Marinimicrobia bacterium]|nr:cupin domain-containing protein [Candidatus Neomarinimicrobiota bacterium]